MLSLVSCSKNQQFLIVPKGSALIFKRIGRSNFNMDKHSNFRLKKDYSFIPNSEIYKTNKKEVEKMILQIFKFTQSKRNEKGLLDIKIKDKNDSIVEYKFLLPVFHANHTFYYNLKSNIFKYEYYSGDF